MPISIEVEERTNQPGTWTVEAIGEDGEIYQAISWGRKRRSGHMNTPALGMILKGNLSLDNLHASLRACMSIARMPCASLKPSVFSPR